MRRVVGTEKQESTPQHNNPHAGGMSQQKRPSLSSERFNAHIHPSCPVHNITHPKTQCRCSSLKSAWVIHEDLLTNFRAYARGTRICRNFLWEWRQVPFCLCPFSLAGLMLVGTSLDTFHLFCQPCLSCPTSP